MEVVLRVLTHINPKEIARYSRGDKPSPTAIGIATMMSLFREGIIGAGIFRNGYNPHNIDFGGFDMHSDVESGMKYLVSPKLQGGVMIGSMDGEGIGVPGRLNGEINELDRPRILWELLKPESEADRKFRSLFPQIFERVNT